MSRFRLTNWLRSIRDTLAGPRRTRRKLQVKPRYRLAIESLEDRTVPTVIDAFTFAQGIAVQGPPVASSSASVSDASILGGERDATVTVSTGPSGKFSTFGVTTGSGIGTISNDSGVSGALRLVYDGADASSAIATGGLSGVNLAATATYFRIIGDSNLGSNVAISVYTDSGAGYALSGPVSQTLPSDPEGMTPTERDYLFSSFAGADFTKVGAIVLDITPLIRNLGMTTALSAFDTQGTPHADTGVSKTGPATVTAGGDVTYTLTISNNGPQQANSVVLTDAVPAGTTFVSLSQSSGPVFTPSNVPMVGGSGTFTESLAVLNVGASATFVVVDHVLTSTSGSISNTVNGSNVTNDPNAANNSSTLTSTVVTSADVSSSKTGPATATAGTNATYTVTVSNSGPSDAQNVRLTDAVPAGTTFVSDTQLSGVPAFALSGPTLGVITATAASLAAGGSASFQIVVHLNSNDIAGNTITNTSNFTTSTTDPNGGNNSSSSTLTIATSADVSVTKTGPASVTAGNNLTYTITVSNAGPSDAQAFNLTDTVPPTFVSQSQTGGPIFSLSNVGNNVSDSIGALAAGASATFQITIRTSPSAVNGSNLSNTANVASTTSDPAPGNNSSTANTTVQTSADVSVTKTGPATVTAGLNVTYTITVNNPGPSDAQNVGVSDTLPSNTSLVSFTQISGPPLTGTMPAGSTAVFTLVCHVNANAPTGNTITNTVSETDTTTDPNPANNTSQVISTITSSADVSVSKTGPATATAGTDITYTITVSDVGPSDAQNVALTDAIPAGTTFVSQSQISGPVFTPNNPPGSISDTLATLAAGASASFQLVVHANPSDSAGSTISNTAIVSTTSTDPTPGNNTSRANTTVATSADVSITKTGPATATAGTDITYSITASNAGPSDAQNLQVVDILPAGTTLVSFVGPGNGGSLAAGASNSYTLVLHVNSNAPFGSTLTNSVTETSSTSDPVSANNSSSASSTVATSADVSVTKTGPATVTAGSNVTYTITVSDAGPSDAQNVSLSDTLPSGTTLVSFMQISGPTLTGTMPAGSTAVFTLVVNVNSDLSDESTITNTANVSSTTSDPDPSNNSSTVNSGVVTSADVRVTKTGPATVTAGTNVTYTIAVSDAGPSDAQNVGLSDTLPGGTTLVSFTQVSGPTLTGTMPAGSTAVFRLVVNVNADDAASSAHLFKGENNAVDSAGGPTGTINGAVGFAAGVVGQAFSFPGSGGAAASSPSVTYPATDFAPGTNDFSVSFFLKTSVSTQQAVLGNRADASSGNFLAVRMSSGKLTVELDQDGGGTNYNALISSKFIADGAFHQITITRTGTTATLYIDGLLDTTGTSAGTTNLTGAFPFKLGAEQGSAASFVPAFTGLLDEVAIAIAPIINVANVFTTTSDPTAGNNTSTAISNVVTSADVSITKTQIGAGAPTATAGSQVTYTITVSNNGPSDAQAVNVTDMIPAGTMLVSFNQNSGPMNGSTLPAGGTETYTVIVTLASNATNGSTITNTASASSTGTPDPNNANNSSSATSHVLSLADVSTTKTANVATVTAGTDLTYTVSVSNTGPSDAQTVQMTDLVPVGTSFVSELQVSGPIFNVTNPLVGSNGMSGPGAPAVTASIASQPSGSTAVFRIVVHALPSDGLGSSITNIANTSTSSNDSNLFNNNFTVTTAVTTVADVAIVKSGPATAPVNGKLTYTVTVTDNGPSDAQNVLMTDMVPSNTTFFSATEVATNQAAMFNFNNPAVGGTGTVSAGVGTLSFGAFATFQIVVNVTGPIDTVISNTANVGTATSDPVPGNNTSSTVNTTVVIAPADIRVTKTGPASVVPGQNITYTVTVTDLGTSDATTVSVTDTVPNGTTFVSETHPAGWSSSNVPMVGGTGTFTESIGTLTNGSSAQFVIVVHSNSNLVSGPITNTATGSASNDTTPGNNSQTVSTTVSAPQADVSVSKSGPALVTAGSNITYTVTVSNSGPSDSQTFRMTDTVPAGTTFVSEVHPGGFSYAGPSGGGTGSMVESTPTLIAGATAQFVIVVQSNSNIANGTVVTNTAVVSEATTDPGPGGNAASGNNVSSVNTTIGTSSDLSVTKTGPATVTAGANVTYTITVSDSGPSAAQVVSLTDAVPAGTTFVSESHPAGWSSSSVPAVGGTGTFTESIGTLAAGSSAVFQIVVKANSNDVSASTISNTANVSATTADPSPGNNSSTVNSNVTTVADVSITKTGPATIVANTNITYTITVSDGGPSDAQSVLFTDLVPGIMSAGTTFVSAAQTSGPMFLLSSPPGGGTGTISGSISTLASGSAATFRIVLHVNAADPIGSFIINAADVTTATFDPNDPTHGVNNNHASFSTRVTTRPPGGTGG